MVNAKPYCANAHSRFCNTKIIIVTILNLFLIMNICIFKRNFRFFLENGVVSLKNCKVELPYFISFCCVACVLEQDADIIKKGQPKATLS